MPDLVDVIFLDIDGVLLPFGGVRDNFHNENLSFTNGCIFPDCTMDALTLLLHRMKNNIFLEDMTPSTKTNDNEESISSNNNNNNHNPGTIQGNPVLVLSSTWRARSEFIQDILSSFRAYAIGDDDDDDDETKVILTKEKNALSSTTLKRITWANHLESFFDITDPNYHATRHDEIYKWVVENNEQHCKQIIISRPNTNKPGEEKKYIVRSWIALDDEDLIHVEGRVLQEAKGHAVRTKSSVGLTLQDVAVGMQLVSKQIQEFHDKNASS